MARFTDSLRLQEPRTGRFIKEDGTYVNLADLFADGENDAIVAAEVAATIFSHGNGVSLRNATAAGLPVFSIRVTAAGALLVPLGVEVFAGSNSYFEVLIDPVLVGASWASAGSGSGAEFDVAATVATGGTRVAAGYAVMAGSAKETVGKMNLFGRLGLEYDIATNTGDILTVVVKSFAGTAATSAEVQWRKITV